MRGKHINLAGKQIDLEVFQEFQGVGGIAERLQEALEPLMRFHVEIIEIRVAALVKPMRSHPGLSDPVHLRSADLDFDRGAERTPQGIMQRLIPVRLGYGDIVLELSRNGIVQAMQCAQRDVAGGNVLDDDAKTVNIQDFGECEMLIRHLLVDAEKLLFAAGNLRIQS